MGDIGDLDIIVSSTADKKGLIEVKFTHPNSEVEILTNKNLNNDVIQAAIKKGNLTATVSKSDLKDTFGGAFIDAGLLNMKLNRATQKYDVLFSYFSLVITASCSQK